MMDTDVIDPCATKEVAMTSLDWCARSRQLTLLNAVLRAHFSNCAISDLEQECGRILRNAVTSGCQDTLVSLLRHVDDAFLHHCQEDDVSRARRRSCDEEDDGGDGGGVVKSRRRRTRLEKLLGLAVEHGHRAVVKVLLTKGANPNCLYRDKPLLHLSLSLGHHDVALLLAESGADVNVTDSKGETPIFAALSSDSSRVNDVIGDLISRGADVNHRSLTGRRPIHSAALTPNAAALARLAEAGCDVSARDSVLGDTPLHLACSRCCQEAAVTLVRHGARFNILNDRGETPLRKLLQHSTRVTAKDFHHHTRMRLARVLVRLGFRLVAPPRTLLQSSPDSQMAPALALSPGIITTAARSLDSAAAVAATTVPGKSVTNFHSHHKSRRGEPTRPEATPNLSALEHNHSPLRNLDPAGLPSASPSSLARSTASGSCAATSKRETFEERAGPVQPKRRNSRGNVDDAYTCASDLASFCGGDRGGESNAHHSRGLVLGGRKLSSRDKVQEAFQSLLLGQKKERKCPALQHLCRMEIRRHLPAVGFQKRVRELELSPQVHQYLMFLPRLLDDTL